MNANSFFGPSAYIVTYSTLVHTIYVSLTFSGDATYPLYNGLQLCEHINGTFPAADGTIQAWKEMLAELKPMRLSWWANLDYWSVQGPVWAQAKAAPKSPVGEFFSWNATAEDECWGPNPDGAQGSWGSDGQGKGWDSALAS